MSPFFRRDQTDRISIFLSEVRACIKIIAVTLIRLNELKSRFGTYEEEMKSQLDMAVSELRSLRELIVKQNFVPSNLGEEVYDAIRLIEAYSIISENEGIDFIEKNAERILRAVRVCDGRISKALRELRQAHK